MAHLVAAGIALALAAQAVLAAVPPLPLPQQCTGPAEGPMPRSDLNWPTNQTKLAQELQAADKNKARHWWLWPSWHKQQGTAAAPGAGARRGANMHCHACGLEEATKLSVACRMSRAWT